MNSLKGANMRFLVSNDDGIQSEGIHMLAASLMPLGEVMVVAPDMERSASGHSITMHHPIRARKVKIAGFDIEAYAVDGTPADCVKLALDELLGERPDYVFTGINRGANLGTDVLYSGTVSAAIEACIMGVPSAAFSLLYGENMDFTYAGKVAAEVARIINDKDLTPSTLINVNIPNVSEEQIRGMKVTKLGHRRYDKSYEKRKDPRGRTYYWLAGELVEEQMDPDTDILATQNHFVSITPLHFNLTSFDMLDTFRQWGFEQNSRKG
jgi:5'-nucleotidase